MNNKQDNDYYDFRVEIERRFKCSGINQIYSFPKFMNDSVQSLTQSSIQSLKDVQIYDLNNQNVVKKKDSKRVKQFMVDDTMYPNINQLIQNVKSSSKYKYNKSSDSKNYSKILDSIEKNITQSNQRDIKDFLAIPKKPSKKSLKLPNKISLQKMTKLTHKKVLKTEGHDTIIKSNIKNLDRQVSKPLRIYTARPTDKKQNIDSKQKIYQESTTSSSSKSQNQIKLKASQIFQNKNLVQHFKQIYLQPFEKSIFEIKNNSQNNLQRFQELIKKQKLQIPN